MAFMLFGIVQLVNDINSNDGSIICLSYQPRTRTLVITDLSILYQHYGIAIRISRIFTEKYQLNMKLTNLA